MTGPRILVLDRDGVINQDSAAYITTPEEWRPITGSIDAIARAKHAGFTIAIATNQSGLGRGYFSKDDLDAMHGKLQALLEQQQAHIDLIAYCPHLPSDQCECRKPKTGLLKQIESQLGQSLSNAWFVGDSLKDLQAAETMGMQPVLVKTGNGLLVFQNNQLPHNTLVFDDLAGAIDQFLKTEN